MSNIRVASLQYFIRPVKSFEEFAAQVSGLVETAKDYKARLILFPEYFSVQLLTLGDVKRPIAQQVRSLTNLEERIIDLMSGLAKQFGIYVAGGTTPGISSESGGKVVNQCHFFSPNGTFQTQAKLHMTRFEKEDWLISPGTRLKIFETDFGKVAITICYDIEFPEIARVAAREGAYIILCPSCTDDRQGFVRVRYCAQARAIENQLYVVHSSTVGSLPMVPAVSLNYGQASILTPSDFAFPRDGILAEGIPNQESMIIGDLNLNLIDDGRQSGTVLPLLDSQSTSELVKVVDHVKI